MTAGFDFGSDVAAPLVVSLAISAAAVASRWMWKRRGGRGPWALTATSTWYQYELTSWLASSARDVIVETTDTGEELGAWPKIGLAGRAFVTISGLDPMPSIRWKGLIRSHGPIQLARPHPTAEPPPGTPFKDKWLAAQRRPSR